MKFKILLWLAKNFKLWKYEGSISSLKASKMPQICVYYPDINKWSINMPIGNAIDYAEIFNGIIKEPKRN